MKKKFKPSRKVCSYGMQMKCNLPKTRRLSMKGCRLGLRLYRQREEKNPLVKQSKDSGRDGEKSLCSISGCGHPCWPLGGQEDFPILSFWSPSVASASPRAIRCEPPINMCIKKCIMKMIFLVVQLPTVCHKANSIQSPRIGDKDFSCQPDGCNSCSGCSCTENGDLVCAYKFLQHGGDE